MKITTFILTGLLAATTVLAQKSNEDGKAGENRSNTTGGHLSLETFQALPSNPADYRIFYGKDENQFGDLRVPSGAGLHPVVILIHGGCWKADFATLRDLAPMADALKAEGIATWNIEYRRLFQSGSGWPGTPRPRDAASGPAAERDAARPEHAATLGIRRAQGRRGALAQLPAVRRQPAALFSAMEPDHRAASPG